MPILSVSLDALSILIMKLQFKQQQFQLDAVASVVDVLLVRQAQVLTTTWIKDKGQMWNWI